MDLILIYSVILLMTCGLAVACGVYFLYENRIKVQNSLFLALVVSLVIWAFGFALEVGAQELQISLIGRRIAPIGCGMMASITLHLVLSLTEQVKRIKKWWVYVLIYLPGVITTAAFTLLPFFGVNSDAPLKTSFGWMYISGLDGWDIFYYIYAILYPLIAGYILVERKKYALSVNHQKNFILLAMAIIFSFVISVIVDVLPALFRIQFPRLSAFPMMILIIAFSHFGGRNQPSPVQWQTTSRMVLSKAVGTRVYSLFGLGIMASGIALFFSTSRIDDSHSLLSASLVSGLLILTGLLLLIVDFLRLSETFKEMQVSMTLSFITPLIVLWFAGAKLFVVWAIFFPLIVISLMFNRRVILITLIVTSLLTTLFQWAFLPEARLTISTVDHIIRLGILGSIVLFAFYVNKNFTSRLRENVNHITMQSIASEISSLFVSVNEQNIDEKLYTTLKRCGEFIECDRAYIALLADNQNEIRYSIEWTAQGISSQIREFEKFFKEMHPKLLRQLKTEQFVMLKDVAALPFTAGKIKQQLISQGIRSMVVVAMMSNGKIIGFLGFNANKTMGDWNLDSPMFIDIANSIIADALTKVADERELNYMAFYDQLTGLPNRVLFNQKLQQALTRAEDCQKMVSIAFLDLDSFKAVNDALGHAQGDRLLKEVARILSSVVRHQDVVGRFGGDEFILLFNQISETAEVIRVMERLIDILQKPILLDDQEFFISVSAGIATYPLDGQTPETLIQNADTAMYHAKALGKNQFVLCSEKMKVEIQDRIQLTNLLYRAQEKNQLVLHYQPQMDIENHQITGVEALLRWDLPEHGLVLPGKFIPIAEQTGLIQSMGAWVLEEACKTGANWHSKGFSELKVSVNISVNQMRSPHFVDTVSAILNKTGFTPASLVLEITEGVTNSNTEAMIAVFHRLKQLGVQITIDDFGTEYSSLSRLKVLPVDRIKIDMQFILGIEKNQKDQAISRVIINLAKSLNLRVIAEGVETEAQLLFLYQRMCDEAQGFYFYRPMPAHEITQILSQ